MLKLYNKEHVAVGALTNTKDYKIEYLLSGEDSSEFSLSICDENINLVEEEGYVRNKNNEYVIKAVDPSQNFKRFSCIVNIEDIKAKSIKNFETSNNTITEAIRLAIAGTGWILADNNITKRRTVRVKNTDALGVLREIRKVFMIDYRFDAINKVIYVYEHFGSDKGVYFSDELNLKTLTVPSDTYDYATRLYCYGKEELNIASVNGGKEYVENFQYSNKVIEKIWTDDRYTIAENLKEDAEAKLEEISKPKRSYKAEIIDLARNNKEYKFLDFFLGDTITLLSKAEKFRDKQRIVKYIEYPNDPSKNTCELGNARLTFEELQKENEAKNQVINNITSDNGTVNGETIDSIKTEQISDFETSVAKITDLTVINAKIENLTATNVTITGELNAVKANIGTLVANVATIDSLTVTHTAQINNLIATSATITQLNAVSATINTLEVEVAKIETLVNGNLSSENIQAGGITSDKLTITNGFITNAMIASLDVAKVNAGDISTNKFRITSDSGNMLIADNTIQIRDKSRVRVQIGKDASNDYNMYVWDANGNMMFDATGLKANGIKDKIIRDDMISDNANIDGGKLNISSVVTSINNGSTTIKGSKVQIDGTNQTLDISFNSLKTEVQGIQVGGRNLLKNTTKERTVNRNFDHELYIMPSSNQITYSVKIKANRNTRVRVYLNDDTGENKLGVRFDDDVEVGTEYKKLTFTKEFPTLTSDIDPKGIKMRVYGLEGDILTGKEAKLEDGNKSTDWTPAPEDTEVEINNIKEITTSQSTTISVMQGQIATAINNTQIIKDGQTILLKDDYNRTVSTVDSIKSTIGSHTTQINQANGKISSVETKVNAVERNLDSITARVSSNETNITNVNNSLTINQQTKMNGQELLPQGYKTNSDAGYSSDYKKPLFQNNQIEVTGRDFIRTDFIKFDRTKILYWFIDIACSINNLFYFGVERYDKDKKVIEGAANQATIYFWSGNGLNGARENWWQESSKETAYIRLRVLCDWNGTGTATTIIKNLSWKQLNSIINEQLTTEIIETKNQVSAIEVNINSINSKVSSVETTTSNINGQMSNLLTRMNSAEQKITADAIISTVSSQYYKKGETDSRYADQSQITQLANQISSKVDVNGVKSIIQQNPNDIMIGFNGINNRININPRSMDFTAVNGNRDMLLYGGQVCIYNNMDDKFLATVGSVVNDKNTFKGTGFLLSKHCTNFVVGRDSNWDDVLTNRSPKPTHAFDVDFANYRINVLYGMSTGEINMRNNSLYGVNVAYIKDLYTFGMKHHNTGKDLIVTENDRLKIKVPMSFDGNDLMNPTLYTNKFFFTNGQLAFGQHSSGANIMMNGVHWDWQGFNIVNARFVGSQMSYSLIATSPGTSVGADTASVETMLLQEDFSKYDELNNAVIVDMNEGFKSVYAKNKKLENENEQLKLENEKLNKELSMTKNALDIILMNAV